MTSNPQDRNADEAGSPEPNPQNEGIIVYINGFPTLIRSLHVTLLNEGRPVAHHESGAHQQASDAGVGTQGEIVSELRGNPFQGEANTLEVCRHLAREWRRRGHRIHLPRLSPDDDDSDCLCESGDAGEQFRIQVVRAIIDPSVWSALARTGRVSTLIASPADAADLLAVAIAMKARRIPLTQRRNLVLALDAMGFSGMALAPVIEEFRKRHGRDCHLLEFASIWIVGRSTEMVFRLDEREARDTV
jgi:hypothetical protein